MHLIAYKDTYPKVNKSCFVADGAKVIGDVTIGAESGIWFNCVLRGDVERITIGKRTNIQDGSVVHTSRFDGPTYIGNDITIGHMALIHACTIKDNAFIGMHSTVMDKAIIEEYGFIAAGSLVTNKKVVKAYELWAGRPAKFIRKVTDDEIAFMHDNIQNYIKLAKEYTG